MAKPPADYAALSLDTPATVESDGAPVAPTPRYPRAKAKADPTQEGAAKAEKGKPYVTYLNPKGHRALRLYALESGGSVQAIILEALETWCKAHGITEPMKPDRTK